MRAAAHASNNSMAAHSCIYSLGGARTCYCFVRNCRRNCCSHDLLTAGILVVAGVVWAHSFCCSCLALNLPLNG